MQKLYFPYKRTIKLRDQKSSKIYFKNWIFKKKYWRSKKITLFSRIS